MCENCIEQAHEGQPSIDQLFAEVRDLLNYNRKVKGPISQQLHDHVEAIRAEVEAESGVQKTDTEISAFTDGVRAEYIAIRCAMIASLALGHTHGAPASWILGEWAGVALNAELESSPLAILLRQLNGE